MEHITTQYGLKRNLLKLTADEYRAIEPFLLSLGVRTRMTKGYYENGVEILEIQGENPYKESLFPVKSQNDVLKQARDYAERMMEFDSIAWYKR